MPKKLSEVKESIRLCEIKITTSLTRLRQTVQTLDNVGLIKPAEQIEIEILNIEKSLETLSFGIERSAAKTTTLL